MLRCDASGHPNPTGAYYKWRDGSVRPATAQDGEYIGFDLAFFDSAAGRGMFMTDAKAEPPKSIDEALKLALAAAAKSQNVTVQEMLAGMQHSKIEDFVAEVAKQYVTALAGSGIAAKFGDSATVIADAQTVVARMVHDAALELRTYRTVTGHLGRRAPSFADWQREQAGGIPAAATLADMEAAQRATRKAMVSDAWRRGRA